MSARPHKTGLVLAGGAARGAYEAGVLAYLIEEVCPDIGVAMPAQLLAGTSVGALHACGLAALADQPREAAARLTRMWTGLRLGDVLGANVRHFGRMLARLVLGRRPATALFDSAPLARLLGDTIPFARIAHNVDTGLVGALSLTATHVASGHSVVFTQRSAAPLPAWRSRRMPVAHACDITLDHALASAAVPLLFPPVRIDGQLYCDGGLRQLVPLSPALELGADALVVIIPRQSTPAAEPADPARERAYGSPLYLLGKTLDALLLDHLDEDVERLQQLNAVLHAGTRRYGASFVHELNDGMGWPMHALRPVEVVTVRASHDLGAMAADHVRSARFTSGCGLAAEALRRVADLEGSRETDLVSYLLFDGDYAAQLVELGRGDARARHEELCTLLGRARVRAVH
ncbi:MAG: patatin-like phospholipase family protein [Deltaproteobacteria bacterium]|nr:patatin-like phospholipase family protein [Deltaproteobacteria bacterium]